MFKKPFIYFSASLLILSCESKKQEAPKQNPGQQAALVDVLIATPGSVDNIIEANGTVVANEYA